MEQEIGHSEVRSSLVNQDPFTAAFTDASRSATRRSTTPAWEGAGARAANGEGPCEPRRRLPGATTQGPGGPAACPTNDSSQRFTAASPPTTNCSRKDTRTATVNGVPAKETSAANECFANRFQNGDLDFDGLDYVPGAWPDGSGNHPTSFALRGAVPAESSAVPADPVRNRRRRLVYSPVQYRNRRPGPARPRRSAPSSTRSGPSASWPSRSGRGRDRVRCGTSAISCRRPSKPSAGTPSTAPPTWPGSLARAPVPVLPNPAVHWRLASFR